MGPDSFLSWIEAFGVGCVEFFELVPDAPRREPRAIGALHSG